MYCYISFIRPQIFGESKRIGQFAWDGRHPNNHEDNIGKIWAKFETVGQQARGESDEYHICDDQRAHAEQEKQRT
jgi:hypothetical protein